ncbi:hypothetical protein C4565_01875 [Candidatus Parcubacteria bacterium]|nr:MAG: hypothetical protein C4565_01875 [Candidatus Parcubacteria bacterium]
MKTSSLIVAILLLFLTSIVSAQKVSDLTISSGRGALSSGLYIGTNVDFGDSKNLTLEATADYVQAMYTKTFGIFSIGPSAGFFQNTPWVGPYIKVQPTSFITLVSWTGVSAGKADNPQFEVEYSFAYHLVRIDAGPINVSLTTLSFQDEKLNCLVGSGITIPLSEKIKTSITCDYSLRDSDPLFGASLCYTF